MSNVTIFSAAGTAPITMTSLELVEYINTDRAERSGMSLKDFVAKDRVKQPGEEAVLQHKDFLEKVLQVLGERSAEFSARYKDTYGRLQPGYRFPKREACLMAMSYSYELQAKVFDHMTALEAKLAAPAHALQLPASTPPVILLREELEAGALLGAPLHMIQSEAVKTVQRQLGVDFGHMLRIAPAQDNIRDEDVMLEPTELGKQLGLSAIAMNQRLAELGLQAKINGAWAPTDAGEPHCSKHAWTRGSKSGVNLKWRARTVLDLHQSDDLS